MRGLESPPRQLALAVERRDRIGGMWESFSPAAQERVLKSQIRDRQREANRLHKVMQETGIKLDTVASDLLGKSDRAMLDALVKGTTDPVVLADLARGRLRTKIPPCARRSTAGSTHSMRWSSGGSSPTSTTSTKRSTSSPRRSRSNSALSQRRLSRSARSLASRAAPPR